MKIILAHISRFKNKEVPWIYFGSSYLKMKNWEKKFSGKRINLQEEIHLQAEIQKIPFLKWIEEQRIYNADSIYWWMTQIAGKNNAYSNFYLNLCQLFAIENYLKKNNQINELFIVCEDAFLSKMILQNFSSKFEFQLPTFLKLFFLKDVIYLFTKGLIKQLSLVYFFITNYFYAKITKPKNLIKPDGDVSLFHHCLDDENSFHEGLIKCKYYNILPHWLKKKKYKSFWNPLAF